MRAEVAPDGTPQMVQGQLIADAGTIVDRDNDKVNLNIDRADFRFNWDAAAAKPDRAIPGSVGRQSVHDARDA